MRVLWFINYPLPIIADKIGISQSVNEGWLTGLSNSLCRNSDVDLWIVFPNKKGDVEGRINRIGYFGYEQLVSSDKYDESLKHRFVTVLEKIDPDVIHIMGSEFPHCWSMVEATKLCDMDQRVLISIQGLVSIYEKHYYAYLPYEVSNKKRTIRDILKKTSIQIEKKKYEKRGEYEVKSFQNVRYTMGRTEWDYACSKQMNPSIQYFHGGETLRNSFYQARWEISNCEKYSLFVSQATYPIKGFHLLLSALGILAKNYPDCKLYVASSVGYNVGFSRPSWRNSQYVNYICSLIKKNGLEGRVIFVGALSEEKMMKQYLNANVFVSPSAIENSSNSIGEAMILGMPIVASYVGGTGDILENGKEGYLYPADEPYMLAHYIEKLFNDPETAVRMGNNAHLRALCNHNKEQNVRDVLKAYNYIIQNNNQ